MLTDATVEQMSPHPPTWWAWVLGVTQKTTGRLLARTHPATPTLQRLIRLTLENPAEAERLADMPNVTAQQLEGQRKSIGVSPESYARLLACSSEHYMRVVKDPKRLAARKRSWHLLANWVLAGSE